MNEKNKLSLNENIFNLAKATPKDINTKKIVEQEIKNVALSKNLGDGILKYTKNNEIMRAYIGIQFISGFIENFLLAKRIFKVK